MDRVSAEFDSIIEYVNELADSIDAISSSGIFNLHHDLADAGNVGAGLDDLHSFSLPANSLATDGDYLRVRYSGTFATNDNDKRIKISLDGQSVHDPGLFDQDSGTWVYDIVYARVSATSVRASVLIMWNFGTRDGGGTAGGNYLFVGDCVTLTVSNLSSNAVTLLVQGEATANNDIVQNLSIIELRQQ